MLAERYHWTPALINELDPDFIDELRAYIGAHGDHLAFLSRNR